MESHFPHFRNGALAAGGYLYAIGSLDFDAPGATRHVERARIASDGTLGGWQEVSPLLENGFEIAVVATASQVYVVGGETQVGSQWFSSASVEAAQINDDGSLGPWRLLNPLPQGRHRAARSSLMAIYTFWAAIAAHLWDALNTCMALCEHP